MESLTEVAAFISLMRNYLGGVIDAKTYEQSFFALMRQLSNCQDNEFQILQRAFADADDYDPIVRLEFTIEEPELKKRVTKSLAALESLETASK